MFRCERCKRITKPGEKQHKKIVQTRQKTYVNIDKRGKEKKTIGSEIVKEINICEECFEITKGEKK